MRKTLLLLAISLFLNCSKSDDNSTSKEPVTNAFIESYSKNYGYSGDEITINGTGFTNDKSKVSILFDDTVAQIISATTTKIVVKLPNGLNKIPEFKLTIENRYISTNYSLNNNGYNGNIAILDKTANTWHKINETIPDKEVYKIQVIDKDVMYFYMQGGYKILKCIDGGITINGTGANIGSHNSNDFHVTDNQNLYFSITQSFMKVNTNGATHLFTLSTNDNAYIMSTYASNDLSKVYCITQGRKIYKSENGGSFSQIYANTSSRLCLYSTDKINENNIWVAGLQNTTSSHEPYQPLVGILKNDQFQEVVLNESLYTNHVIRKLNFINENIGFAKLVGNTTKILRTNNGGTIWHLVKDNINFTNFSFKDENIGWYCYQDKIYKTTDGGSNWTLDYSNNGSNVLNIAYKNGVVWAISTTGILKYYTN